MVAGKYDIGKVKVKSHLFSSSGRCSKQEGEGEGEEAGERAQPHQQGYTSRACMSYSVS